MYISSNIWLYVYIDMCKLQPFCFLLFISSWTFRPRQLQMDLSRAQLWESGQDVGSFARLLHHFSLVAKVLPLHALALFIGALVCCWVQKGVHWVHPACCSRFTWMQHESRSQNSSDQPDRPHCHMTYHVGCVGCSSTCSHTGAVCVVT